jgi:hypothetical protein
MSRSSPLLGGCDGFVRGIENVRRNFELSNMFSHVSTMQSAAEIRLDGTM